MQTKSLPGQARGISVSKSWLKTSDEAFLSSTDCCVVQNSLTQFHTDAGFCVSISSHKSELGNRNCPHNSVRNWGLARNWQPSMLFGGLGEGGAIEVKGGKKWECLPECQMLPQQCGHLHSVKGSGRPGCGLLLHWSLGLSPAEAKQTQALYNTTVAFLGNV